MTVNTITKVTNLNSDYLDGLDSTGLTRVMRVPFSLATGAVSAPITVPANVPVQLVGVNLSRHTKAPGRLRCCAFLVRSYGSATQ